MPKLSTDFWSVCLFVYNNLTKTLWSVWRTRNESESAFQQCSTENGITIAVSSISGICHGIVTGPASDDDEGGFGFCSLRNADVDWFPLENAQRIKNDVPSRI